MKRPDIHRLWTLASIAALASVLVLQVCRLLLDGDGVLLFAATIYGAVLLPATIGILAQRKFDAARRIIRLSILTPAVIVTLFEGYVTGDDAFLPRFEPFSFVWFALIVVVAFDRMLCIGATAASAFGSRKCWLIAGSSLAALGWGIGLAVAGWGPVSDPALDRNLAASEALSFLESSFPHWGEMPCTSEEISLAYSDRLDAADRSCGEDTAVPCLEQLRVLRELFAELQNGHTEVMISGELGRPQIMVEPVQGEAVVTAVAEGSDAEREGIKPGMRIDAVAGRPVQAALLAVPAWRLAYASPHSRLYWSYRRLLEGPAETKVEIRVGEGDARRVVFLKRKAVEFTWEDEEEQEDDVFADVLDDGIGYLAINSFSSESTVSQFDRALDSLSGTNGLVLDLRSNGGGNVDRTHEILGRFWQEPLKIGEDCVISRLDEETTESRCYPRNLEPGGRPWTGPLAVLIDETTFSAAEVAAHALCRSGRARCFGRPTAGESDCVRGFEVPGGLIAIASAAFRPAFGPEIYGVGVQPDVPVELKLEALQSERDDDLNAARSWLVELRTANSGWERRGRERIPEK